MTDAELLERITQHDSQAWTQLYRRYVQSIWRYAYALCGDTHAADDIVSESMLALVRNIHSVDPETFPVYAWLRQVTKNKSADYHRKQIRSERLVNALNAERSANVDDAHPASSTIEQETRREIVSVLDRLADKQRLILEWKYIDNLSVREIAVRIETTERAVQSMLYRARQDFRRLFDAYSRKERTTPVDHENIAAQGKGGNSNGAT